MRTHSTAAPGRAIFSDAVPTKQAEAERLEGLRKPICRALRRRNLLHFELLAELQAEHPEVDGVLLSKALRHAARLGDVRCIGRRFWHLV